MDMHVVGADVYLAGDSAQGAWYCRNADMFLLDGAGSRSFGIFVTNSTVHASGVSSSNTACLWINGSLTNLLAGMTNMARVSGFTIRGTDQYAVGYHTTSSQDHLWLWKNGVRTDLYASLDLDEVMFAVVGGTVHIAVTDDAAAEPKVVYLKDGEARDIATQAGAKAICVVEQ
jgi:hypothetical protein